MLTPSNPDKPLLDRTILVACSPKKMVELVSGLREMGGNVLPFPVIEIQEIEDRHLLDGALASLHKYSWIIFTSAHSVSFFLKRLKELGTSTAHMPKICAIGPATARAVNDHGYEVALVPEQFVAEGVVDALVNRAGGTGALAGTRILLPRAQEGREVLPESLRSCGAEVDVVPCYRTVRREFEADVIENLRSTRPDLIIFTSSSTVRNMIDILGREDGKRMLLRSMVAVLGPVTGSTLESFGKRAEIIPKENTIASLLREIRAHFGGNLSEIESRQ